MARCRDRRSRKVCNKGAQGARTYSILSIMRVTVVHATLEVFTLTIFAAHDCGMPIRGTILGTAIVRPVAALPPFAAATSKS